MELSILNSSNLPNHLVMIKGKQISDQMPKWIQDHIQLGIKADRIHLGKKEVALLDVMKDDQFGRLAIVTFEDKNYTPREITLQVGKALRNLKNQRVREIAIHLDEAFTTCEDIMRNLLGAPLLVSYEFNRYKKAPKCGGFTKVEFVTAHTQLESLLEEAKAISEATIIARELGNEPPRQMTPIRLGEEALMLGKKYGIDTQVFSEQAVKSFGMNAFLEVGRGASDRPVLIVMRYRGNPDSDHTIGLVGKGLMYDSGGYDIKNNMVSMHGDMCGAAAVIGAMTAIAKQQLKINVVTVVAACKNMLSGDSYVAGDLLKSMSGRYIEVLNTDAEGRLTLADAVTYALYEEKADVIIDIATLTGAANGAVGFRSSAILTDDATLLTAVHVGAISSCEKVWRLDLDRELRPFLDSEVADIKNVNLGGKQGAGTALGAMFVEEFTDGKPFLHIDIAPVNWTSSETELSIVGATGYGAALLYHTMKNLTQN